MQIAFFSPLSRAWERMKHVLMHPFDLPKWLVIGFAAWLAGLADSAGGGGWKWIADDNDFSRRMSASSLGESWRQAGEALVWLPLLFLIIMAVATLLVIVLWLSSRAKFIFLDNLVRNQAAIVEPWHRLRNRGNSLFLWRLAFIVVTGLLVLALLLLFIAPAATLQVSDWVAGLSYAAMALGFLILLVIGVVFGYVALFLEAFIIPIMYKFDLKATEAWRYFLPWFKSRPLPFLLYGLLVLVLGIGFVIIFAAACVFTCCIIALPYVGTVILLPIWATYRLFSVEFLAQFDPGFDLFAPIEPAPAE